MEHFNWTLINFLFGVMQFSMAVIAFCIIKFNDLKHLENRMTKHEDSHAIMEQKQNERHEKVVQSINSLAIEVAYLTGRKDLKKE